MTQKILDHRLRLKSGKVVKSSEDFLEWHTEKLRERAQMLIWNISPQDEPFEEHNGSAPDKSF